MYTQILSLIQSVINSSGSLAIIVSQVLSLIACVFVLFVPFIVVFKVISLILER